MKLLNRDFLSVLVFWKTNCKFSCACNSFSNLNYTCTRRGGNYCGLYRTLKDKPQDKIGAHPEKQKDEAAVFLPNPSLYEPEKAEVERTS